MTVEYLMRVRIWLSCGLLHHHRSTAWLFFLGGQLTELRPVLTARSAQRVQQKAALWSHAEANIFQRKLLEDERDGRISQLDPGSTSGM